MATTVMKVKGQFKNIWTPPQKTKITFLYLGKYKAFVRNVLKNFAGLNFPLKSEISLIYLKSHLSDSSNNSKRLPSFQSDSLI